MSQTHTTWFQFNESGLVLCPYSKVVFINLRELPVLLSSKHCWVYSYMVLEWGVILLWKHMALSFDYLFSNTFWGEIIIFLNGVCPVVMLRTGFMAVRFVTLFHVVLFSLRGTYGNKLQFISVFHIDTEPPAATNGLSLHCIRARWTNWETNDFLSFGSLYPSVPHITKITPGHVQCIENSL